MPTNVFYELSDTKKQNIISISISEFAKHGYLQSSTNRIVKNAGISKGSLFKYFESKEELYFYLLECVIQEFISSLNETLVSLPNDLFKRVIQYSEWEFSWYIQNPDKFQLIFNAFSKNESDIYQKIEARFNYESQNIYYSLLEDIDTKPFKWDKRKTIDMLKWVLQGFNEEFISKIDVKKDNISQLDRLKNEYVNCLTDYMEMLKKGFLQ